MAHFRCGLWGWLANVHSRYQARLVRVCRSNRSPSHRRTKGVVTSPPKRCAFLSSQQGRLRVDDGHGAIAPSLTSEHDSALPVDSPGRFQLGPAWISFFPPTCPARTGHCMRAIVLFFFLCSLLRARGVISLRDSQTEAWPHSDITVFGLGPLAKTLIPTPHNSPVLLTGNLHLPGDSSEARDGGGPNGLQRKGRSLRTTR